MLKSSFKTSNFKHAIPALLSIRRKELGLTLQKLGDASNLSAAFISQAERGLTTPSIASLMKISSALKVDVSYFLSSPKVNSLFHYADTPQPLVTDSPVSYVNITSNIKNKKLNNVIITIPPHYDFPVNSEEFSEDVIYVLSGQVLFRTATDEFLLNHGDTAHFNTYFNLRMSNPNEFPATVLRVSTSVSFP